MMPKFWHALALWLAGIGALNLGLTQFLNFDILGIIPGGATVMNVLVGAIGFSGGYLLWLKLRKKI